MSLSVFTGLSVHKCLSVFAYFSLIAHLPIVLFPPHFYDHKLKLPTSVLSTTKDFDKFTTESAKASAPAKVLAMQLVIPPTIPEPTAITRTAVKTLTSLPSNFQHSMPSSTQQAIAIVAEAQVLHKDNVLGGEKVNVSVLTPGGSGEDMGELSHKGSAADLVTVPTLMVATMDAGLSDKAIPTSSTAEVNLWFGETDDGKASLEIGSSVSSASPLSGDGKTAHVLPNFLYSSEVDYQSDPADLSPVVSQCPLAGSISMSQDQAGLQIQN